MLPIRPLTAALLLALVAPGAQASDRAPTDARWTPRAPAGPLPVAALARDPGRGVPSLFWSPTPVPARPGMTAEAAARYHLTRHRDVHGSSRAAIAGARLRFVHDTGRGGTIVALTQRVGDVDVYRGDVKVLLDPAHRLLAISGAPHPAARPASARPFTLPPTAAIVAALRDLQRDVAAARVVPTGVTRGGWVYFDLAAAKGVRLRRPARVKPVYFPAGDALIPAHFVELQIQGRAGLEAYQLVIAADDGRLLHRRDATAYESFQYRVYADADGDHRPFDGPLEDYTPHPIGKPIGGPKLPATANLITMEGFNTNPEGEPDPWLAPGATDTRGNNVDAYVDHKNPTGLQIDQGEFRASTTAPGVFDRLYDITKEPLADQTQSMAAITGLFYVTNWMHDWWYDSGFVEATGNAQSDNYERGGMGGDPLLAEAQDAALVGTRNNANMSTLSDGTSPVMQMYLWTPLIQTKLTVDPLGQNFTVNGAGFGPKNYDLTAPLVLVQDSGGVSPTDSCEAPVNDVAGKIVLVDRGNCTFEFKVAKAQAAGALGVLIANNADGAFTPGADNNVVDPTIPTQGITKADGAALKAALAQPQTAHMIGSSTTERDGTIDNMIVAHEWGHFIHHRLTDCGNNQCRAQSEGWGDFNAVLMAMREGDDLHGVYGNSPYASFDPTGYFGLRRVPYTVDFTRNAFSLRHISNGEPLPMTHPLGPTGGPNSEVHNAGEVWATMMWEVYIALHEAHPELEFEEVHRLMGDYVVSGMMLAVTDPTYTEMRDGLLMAAHAADPDDFITIAEAFARRGAGSCAVSPPRASTDFIGVKEDFTLRAAGTITGVTLSDDAFSCDDDGIIDVGEHGTLKVTVFNHGAAIMPPGATVEIVDPDPALVLPQGPLIDLGAIDPFEQVVVELPVELDPATVDHLARAVTVRLTTPDGCEDSVETFIRTDFNGDVLPNSATVDDAEAPGSGWTTGGTEEGDAVWARLADLDGWVWHGADVGRVSDTWLATPTLLASDVDPLVISFDHAYSFEFSDNTNWDGGVIEVSGDDGMTWQDVSAITDPGYKGAIKSAANPLDKRMAFVDKNAAYPALEPLVLDLGLAFAGKPVKLRFRIGTDAAAGAPGWDIDNIAVDGITNTPFSTWIADQTEDCVFTEESTGTGSDTGDSSGDSSAGTTAGDTGSTAGTTAGTTADDTTAATTANATSGGTTDGVSASSGDTTPSTTDNFTTGNFTTGSFTTGTPGTGDTGGDDGVTPTEGGPGGDDTANGDVGGSTANATETDSATGGATGVDDGCGCNVDERDGWLWQLAPWLGIAALRRRRRRA